MSTQGGYQPLGEQSDHMQTEGETRMNEDGINHNIEEQMSQRIGVSQNPTERTRHIQQLQQSMQSSMRSSKDRAKK